MTDSTISDTYRIIKKVTWHSAIRPVLRDFPRPVRREVGDAIFKLQIGLHLAFPLSRPFPQVGKGVEEIRVKDTTGIYRAFYLARLSDRVLVFHAFQKKSQKTPKREIELGRKRLMEVLNG